MSNISNIHAFAKLDKTSKALSGQRLVRLIAKGENKHVNLAESLCVSVPRVETESVVEVIDRLLPHIVGLVQDTQDKIIRDWRIEHGRAEIPGEAFGLEQVIEYLDANAAGDRVTSEYLSEWFKEEYEQLAQTYIAQIMGADITPDNVPDVVVQKTNILREMFMSWANPKNSPAIPKLKAMIRFAECCRDSDAIDGRMTGLLTKASAMLAKKEMELNEDALGF